MYFDGKFLLGSLFLALSVMAEKPERQAVEDALRSACSYWAENVAYKGGYVWEYSTDLTTRRRGESKDLPQTTAWVQSGTPMVGETYLAAYRATGEKLYLDAALAAGKCLAYGQLKTGGWTYSIEFDPQRIRHHYHHLEPAFIEQAREKNPKRRFSATTTFDDNNTQSATRFLMHLDEFVDDPEITATIDRALACFLTAQYKGGKWDGAWPQRYPYPKKGYGMLPTYNDNTMSDCLRTMLQAYETYGKKEYLDSVNRCLEFYLRSQFAPPQATWAQQYDKDLKPAWARRFEPPSLTSSESVGNCRLLLSMFVEFGDRRYLDAVGRCVEWLKASELEGEKNTWARFYEVDSNRPLYFTKLYKLTYKDDDLPVHYCFKSSFGIPSLYKMYERMKAADPAQLKAQRDRVKTAEDYRRIATKSAQKIEQLLAGLDEQGRWKKRVARKEQVRDKEGRYRYEFDEKNKLDMMYSRTFCANVRYLSNYLTALREGPAVVEKKDSK